MGLQKEVRPKVASGQLVWLLGWHAKSMQVYYPRRFLYMACVIWACFYFQEYTYTEGALRFVIKQGVLVQFWMYVLKAVCLMSFIPCQIGSHSFAVF